MRAGSRRASGGGCVCSSDAAVEADAAIARSEADAPEIDGIVRVKGTEPRSSRSASSDVVITRASEYDLEARLA